MGEANEAVASGPPQKCLIEAHFAVDVILGIIMKLGRKVGNRSSIRSEDFFCFFVFLKITMILGEKREIQDQSHIFFKRTSSFGNSCLGPLSLNIHHWPQHCVLLICVFCGDVSVGLTVR